MWYDKSGPDDGELAVDVFDVIVAEAGAEANEYDVDLANCDLFVVERCETWVCVWKLETMKWIIKDAINQSGFLTNYLIFHHLR